MDFCTLAAVGRVMLFSVVDLGSCLGLVNCEMLLWTDLDEGMGVFLRFMEDVDCLTVDWVLLGTLAMGSLISLCIAGLCNTSCKFCTLLEEVICDGITSCLPAAVLRLFATFSNDDAPERFEFGP